MFARTLFVILSLPFSLSVFSTTLVYTDESRWREAVAGSVFLSDDFIGLREDLPADASVSRDFLTITLNGGISDSGPTGLNGSGYLQAEVDNASDPLSVDIGFFPAKGLALVGIQNDSQSKPSDLALDEILLTISGRDFVLADIVGQSIGQIPFLGFVNDPPIDGFSLAHASLIKPMTRYSEEFFIDRIIIATANAVPAPAILPLFVTGLCILLFGVRSRIHKGRRAW